MTEQALRPATPDDVPALARLQLLTALHAYRDIFPPEAPLPTLEGLEQQWRRRVATGSVVVAVEGGEVVGSSAGSVEAGIGEVSGVYVEPGRWGRGLGGRLVEAALESVRRGGGREARLWVLEANHPVRRWYERRGWRLVPGETRVVWGPVVDVRYRRDLAGEVARPGEAPPVG